MAWDNLSAELEAEFAEFSTHSCSVEQTLEQKRAAFEEYLQWKRDNPALVAAARRSYYQRAMSDPVRADTLRRTARESMARRADTRPKQTVRRYWPNSY